MDEKKTIVTHSSSFHTDDIFAVATLILVFGRENVSVIRSRDMSVIEMADYVLDVGGIYDEFKNRFDHHQIGGAGKRENGVPYASFGLVWKKFGEGLSGSKEGAERVDKIIVQPIDAGDNGFQFIDTRVPDLYPFDIGALTHFFSPTWKEEGELSDVFMKLVSYAEVIISRIIIHTKDMLESEKFVIDSYKKAEDKRLIEVEEGYSWMGTLSRFPEPLFVFYQNRDNQWTLKNIRDNQISFEPRKKLPESWAGKRNEELEKITGVSGAVFCHNGRFMAVAKTREAILKLADLALNQ